MPGRVVPIPAIHAGGSDLVQNVPPQAGACVQKPARPAVEPVGDGLWWAVLPQGRRGKVSEPLLLVFRLFFFFSCRTFGPGVSPTGVHYGVGVSCCCGSWTFQASKKRCGQRSTSLVAVLLKLFMFILYRVVPALVLIGACRASPFHCCPWKRVCRMVFATFPQCWKSESISLVSSV